MCLSCIPENYENTVSKFQRITFHLLNLHCLDDLLKMITLDTVQVLTKLFIWSNQWILHGTFRLRLK